MRATVKDRLFRIREFRAKEHGYEYAAFEVRGVLNGERVRRRFRNRDEAIGEQNRLEVLAANGDGSIRAINTRLNIAQIVEAETAFARLGTRSLAGVVDWYLLNYRPPVTATNLEEAAAAFMSDRALHVRPIVLRGYPFGHLADRLARNGDLAIHAYGRRRRT